MEDTNMYQALNSMGSKCYVPKDKTFFSMKNIFPAETIHVVCKPA